jgi:hypothetical protein
MPRAAASLRNLGPKPVLMLAEAGIRSLDELSELGAEEKDALRAKVRALRR